VTSRSWIGLAVVIALVVGVPLALDAVYGSLTSSQQITLAIVGVGFWIVSEIRRAPVNAEDYRRWRRMLRKEGLAHLPDNLARQELGRRAAKASEEYAALEAEREQRENADAPLFEDGDRVRHDLGERAKRPQTPRKRD